MKCKFSLLLLFLCALPFAGQAQNSPLQELVNKKQFAAVIAYADSLTPTDSADYATMSALGQAYEGMLRYKEAYKCYDYSLSKDTLNVDALNAVARVSMNLGKASVAERSFRKVLSQDSANFYANYQLARLYYQSGDYEKAVNQYTILRELDTLSVNPTIFSNLADCFAKMDDLQSATYNYFLAYQANRENAGLASTLINTLLRLGGPNVLDALEVCDTALYYNPGNRLLTRNKGIAFYMNRSYGQADSVYTCLLTEGDSSFLTLKYGGASRYLSGRALDAVPLLELAYNKDTTDVETNLLLGAALGKTYDRKRAFRLFDQAEKLMQPNEALANLLLTSRGETLWKDGRRRDADALFYKAWLENKDRTEYLYRIDRQYTNMGTAYKNDEERSRALFIKHLFLKECLLTRRPLKGFHVYRFFLDYMREDAFFRSTEELEMIAPDGKKSQLSVADLRALIDKLPEVPEEEKVLQQKFIELSKQRKDADQKTKAQKETQEIIN